MFGIVSDTASNWDSDRSQGVLTVWEDWIESICIAFSWVLVSHPFQHLCPLPLSYLPCLGLWFLYKKQRDQNICCPNGGSSKSERGLKMLTLDLAGINRYFPKKARNHSTHGLREAPSSRQGSFKFLGYPASLLLLHGPLWVWLLVVSIRNSTKSFLMPWQGNFYVSQCAPLLPGIPWSMKLGGFIQGNRKVENKFEQIWSCFWGIQSFWICLLNCLKFWPYV